MVFIAGLSYWTDVSFTPEDEEESACFVDDGLLLFELCSCGKQAVVVAVPEFDVYKIHVCVSQIEGDLDVLIGGIVFESCGPFPNALVPIVVRVK